MDKNDFLIQLGKPEIGVSEVFPSTHKKSRRYAGLFTLQDMRHH
jgi:hypothetical protein